MSKLVACEVFSIHCEPFWRLLLDMLQGLQGNTFSVNTGPAFVRNPAAQSWKTWIPATTGRGGLAAASSRTAEATSLTLRFFHFFSLYDSAASITVLLNSLGPLTAWSLVLRGSQKLARMSLKESQCPVGGL